MESIYWSLILLVKRPRGDSNTFQKERLYALSSSHVNTWTHTPCISNKIVWTIMFNLKGLPWLDAAPFILRGQSYFLL